jgi:lipoprotein-anchoring transpeptidase ErfK/SrfK
VAGDGTARTIPTWGIVAGAIGALLALVTAGAVASAAVWHDDLLAADRLLPGSAIAGVDLGHRTVDDARAVAEAAGAEALDRTIALTHEGERWELTPADVGGFADVDTAVDVVATSTRESSVLRAATARWLGLGGKAVPVRVSVDDAAVTGFVDEVVAAIDRAPQDATAIWGPDGVELVAHATGRTTDRTAALDAVRAALAGNGPTTISLQVVEAPYRVAADAVEAVLAAVATAAEEALERTVAVVAGDREWHATARELGAVPDLQGLVEEGLAARPAPVEVAVATPALGGQAPAHAGLDPAVDDTGVPEPELVLTSAPALQVEGAGLAAFIDAIAAEVEVPVRDAGLNLAGGWVELVPEQQGRTVDREGASNAVAEALAGGTERVELPFETVEPTTTADQYEHVLLVRQDQRKLYLFVDGEVTREWPVAIGAAGHATPTGVFSVGAKRYLPTWVNPAPNGWGRSMPAQVGPGPNNPLGLRALNWLRDGRETLIRFHGTANLSSIGSAASKGCIRLRNSDVVELYDLVPEGTTIISTWG